MQNFKHYVCVGVKERKRTERRRERECATCVTVCVCKVNIRFYRLLLFAGLLQHATRDNEIERERGAERGMEATPWSAAVLGILYVWGTGARPATGAGIRA